jgi:WD40 repeat protein
LTVPELCVVAQVNRKWRRITSDFTLWKAKYMQRFLIEEETRLNYKEMYKSVHLVSKNWRLGRCLAQVLRSHKGAVNSLQYDQNTSKLVSASSDRTVKVWSVEDSECLYLL